MYKEYYILSNENDGLNIYWFETELESTNCINDIKDRGYTIEAAGKVKHEQVYDKVLNKFCNI